MLQTLTRYFVAASTAAMETARRTLLFIRILAAPITYSVAMNQNIQ